MATTSSEGESRALAPIRMIALDMDGTCLNGHHQFSDRTIQKLRSLNDRGVTIAFATGRTGASVWEYLQQLDLSQEETPVICNNGSYAMRMPKNGDKPTVIVAKPVAHELAVKLVDFANSKGYLVQYYNGTTGIVYTSRTTPEHVELSAKYAALVGKEQTNVESFDEVLAQFQPAKVLLLTSDVDTLLSEVEAAKFSEHFHIIRGSPEPAYFVEFLTPNVEKGSALVAVAAHMGISLEEIVAFGDGDNDIEMLCCVGHGVAMCNAREKVRQAAAFVSDFDNNDDGVARYLDKLEEQGRFAFQC